jgi:catechol 2,3-dioxygenase-like lactoylglutathione lyase family enzyme
VTLLALDHINVRTSRLEALCRFYCEVLGLERGPRPNFSFGGAWLYCGERPVLHLVEVAAAPTPGADLRLQHFAFRGRDLASTLHRLKQAAVPFRLGFVNDFRLCQVNLTDPDGNQLHIDFPLDEARALALCS